MCSERQSDDSRCAACQFSPSDAGHNVFVNHFCFNIKSQVLIHQRFQHCVLTFIWNLHYVLIKPLERKRNSTNFQLSQANTSQVLQMSVCVTGRLKKGLWSAPLFRKIPGWLLTPNKLASFSPRHSKPRSRTCSPPPHRKEKTTTLWSYQCQSMERVPVEWPASMTGYLFPL